MSVKPARCPRKLGPDGRRLWHEIAGQVADDGLEMDKRELETLRAACREADVLARIEDALTGEPMTVTGAQGQLVSHPLIGEARRSRTTIHNLLKAIGLDGPEAVTGRGSRTTSSQARAAALARHGIRR